MGSWMLGHSERMRLNTGTNAEAHGWMRDIVRVRIRCHGFVGAHRASNVVQGLGKCYRMSANVEASLRHAWFAGAHLWSHVS